MVLVRSTYADLSGEPPFVRSSVDLYITSRPDDIGARIVHAPVRTTRENTVGELVGTDFVVRAVVGGLSGRTIASLP
ncbi:hypothetical protein [Mycobacterium lepromatosis]|uniref:hypothetical protein n=1 Tax=Mycobacterium lepromatosis TaxID=480418 RepID=UPI00138E17FA|nr:hypothetical protein [Mycobacterium lepromatosis]